MARELRLDVASKSNDAGLKEAAANVDRLRREADRLGDEFRQAERAAAGLDRELVKTKLSAAALATEFSKTNDAGVKKELEARRAAARELQKLRSDVIGDSERDAKAATAAWTKASNDLKRLMRDSGKDGAKTFAQLFEGGLIDAFMSLPPEVKVAVANAAAAVVVGASAAIGAALNGAIVAAIGAGAIAAGIAGQVDDPMVRDAWAGFASDLKSDFSGVTDSFARPIAYSANIFRTEWRRVLPDLERDLEGLSKFVVPLASGVAQMFSGMGPGLSRLLEAAGPLLQVVADELPKFGREIGKAFGELADSSEGAADGIRFLFLAMETLIVGTAKLISGLSTLFHWIVVGTDDITGFLDVLLGWIPGFGRIYEGVHNFTSEIRNTKDHVEDLSTVGRELTKDAAAMGVEFYNTADAARGLDEAFSRLFGTQMSVDQANLAVNEGLLALKDTLKEGAHTLDTTTEAGQRHVRGILEQIRRLDEKRQADIAAGNGTKEATQAANAAYASQVESLKRLLIQMGYTKAEVDALISKYKQIPDEINTDINTYHHDYYSSSKAPIGPEERKYGPAGKRASGGPVTAGMPYIVGDGGRPELFVPNVNGRILPQVPTGGSWSGGTSRPLQLTHTGTAAGLEAMFLTWLENQIRIGALQVVEA